MDTDPLPMHGQSHPKPSAAQVPSWLRAARPEIGITLAPLSWRLGRIAFAKLGVHVGCLQIWLDW